MTCLFCQIAEKKIPANVLYEDDQVLAFHDAHPQAPTHVLIIPKQHIDNLNHIHTAQAPLLSHLVVTATQLAHTLNLSDAGYRLVINTNQQGGQTVYHLHCHLLGGRQLTWPPG